MFKNYRSWIVIFIITLMFLFGYVSTFWAQKPGGSIVLAHCGDYVIFLMSPPYPGEQVVIKNLCKNNPSRIKVEIGPHPTINETVDVADEKVYLVESGHVKITLLETGSGGPCRSNCSGPKDSDVRVYIPKSAYNIDKCHIESKNTCPACGASLSPVVE